MVHTINSLYDLEKHRALWREAFGRNSAPQHPFIDFAWMSIYAKYFLCGKKLDIKIYKKSDGIAIFPFQASGRYLSRVKFAGGKLCDYNDLVISSSDPLCVESFISDSKVSLMSLSHLREDAAFLPLLKGVAARAPYRVRLKNAVDSFYLSLRDTNPEQYYKSLKPKFRRDLARREKKLSCLGKLEFGFCVDRGKLGFFIGKMADMHIKRRRYLGQDRSIFTDKKMKSFFLEAAAELLGEDKLRLFYLKLNGKVIAVVFCFLYQDIIYHYIPAFDVEYDKYSPGRILNYRIINFAFSNRLKEIDFMTGDEGYKLEWNTKVRRIYNCFLFRKNWQGMFFLFVAAARDILARAKSGIEKSRLKSFKRRIRKILYSMGR